MKKLILILFAVLLGSTLLKAQKTVVVCGQIDRAVVNQTVWINYFSTPSTCNVIDSTHTDSTGKYSYTFTVGSGCAYRNVIIGMLGCKSIYDSLYQFKSYKPTGLGPDTIKANFSYCDTCTLKASFTDSTNGLKVNLTNTTPNSNNKYKWYFGDTSNTTSTLKNPSFTYSSAGSYTVCLVVEDTLGVCKDSICKTIFVGCNSFQANFIDTVDGYCVRLYNTSSSQANKFSWSFGALTPNANYRYNTAGNYNLCLIAQDSTNGCADTLCKTITIGTTCNCFEASFNSVIPNDTGFFFNTSTNAGLNSNTYTWRFGDGATSNQKNPQHIYASSGSYNVTLITKDTVRNCTDSTTTIIGISTCNNFSAGFSDTVKGDTLKMGSYGTSTNANKFTWTYGDGQSSVINGRTWPFGSAATHIYSTSGTYNVCLIAEDTVKGCLDTTCKQIVIGSTNPCIGFTANFSDSVQSDTATFVSAGFTSSSANKFLWTFGNGQSYTTQNPTVIYSTGGVYIVCLLAQDTINGCIDSICRQITVTIPNACTGFTANFSDSVQNDTATFVSAGLTSSSANKFLWTFGNGQTSNAQNPTIIYNTGGVYTVCLFAQDTINGCSDSLCRQITITIPNACTGFTANFSDSVQNDTASFTYTGSIAANKFSWNFGNGQTSNAQNPTHIYAKDSLYSVCLVAEDTINNCTDNICRNITINTGTACAGFNADFSFTIKCDSVDFVNSSSSSANKFSWNFGNSQISSNPNSSQWYNSSGTYTACLVAEDTVSNCSDSSCKTILIKNSLEGTVFRNNNQKADSGRVWLIEVSIDSITNDTILTAIDSALFIQPDASYSFTNIPSGDYLLKAALLPGAAFYNNRLPTYYDKETRWDKATKVQPTICSNVDIVLRAGNNPGGAGFISGLVKQGANKTGEPLEKVVILLFNADGSPFGFTNTDANGQYEFANIAYGDYKVVVDVLGKPSDEYFVTVNASKPNDNKGNFEVNTKDVKLVPFTPGGLNELITKKLSLYPNPTNNKATALFESKQVSKATITIMDLTGKTVKTQSLKTIVGNNEAELEISTLSNGLYIVTINTGIEIYTGRLGVNR